MIETVEKVYNQGKKSLDEILREKAYSDVKETLQEKGIDINQVSDTVIESLVADKVKDTQNTLKGVGLGALGSIAFSLVTGI